MRYLYDKTEKIILEFDSEIFEHPYLSTGNRVISARKGEAVGPLHPGHYLIYEDTGKAEKQIRYLGIAGDHSVIMQMTVGVFTADTFDSVAHAKRVPLNYYIGPTQVIDSTFRGYEQDYGDALYPHMMPNQFGIFDESFHQLNSNWESLTTDEIVIRLQKMDEYFQGKGLRPLHGEFENGYREGARIMASGADAVLFDTDRMAAGFLKYAAEERIDVPDRIAVVGFDDDIVARMSVPSLSTVAHPVSEINSTILEIIERNPEEIVRRIFPTRFVPRDSSR